MTDAPALTPRTDAQSNYRAGVEQVPAYFARTLECDLQAAIADRHALQLALNAAIGRADGLEVALREWYLAMEPLGLFGQGGSPDQWSLIWRCWHNAANLALAVDREHP